MSFTPRETRVLEALAQGKSVADIAKTNDPIFGPATQERVQQVISKAVRKAIFYSGFFEKHSQCRKDQR